MCLAVPMEIVEILSDERARVARSGDGRVAAMEVDVSMIDNPSPGDFVIVHAGYAIERLDTGDALERIDLLSAGT